MANPNLWGVVFRRCAPLVFHELNGLSERDQRIDSITLVDALADWGAVPDNPELAWERDIPAWLYYEVVKGEQYWYILFQVYHPIDKKYLPFDVGSHPQDLEWILVVYDVEKGRVVAGGSLFHYLQYWAYVPGSGLEPKSSYFNVRRLHIDPPTNRPTFHIQAGGHGIRPFDPERSTKARMIYTPNQSVADIPVKVDWFTGTIPPLKSVRYRLSRLTQPGGLWSHRRDPGVFRTVNRQSRLVAKKNGQIVTSPATPLWSTGLASQLIRVETDSDVRWLSPLVVRPHELLRHAFKGVRRDRLIENPFTA